MATHAESLLYQDVLLLPGPASIRIIILERGNFEDDISCRLQAATLELGTEYEALSYVWGDPKETFEIQLNNYKFQARTNLVAALHYLRQKDSDRRLWVDALCINQNDKEEQAEQVNLMTQIYEKAQRVVVWLGELVSIDDRNEPYHAVHFLNKVVEASHIQPLTVETLESICEDLEGGIMEYQHCIYGLLDSDWFDRLWVLQEVAVGQDVIVMRDSLEFPWSLLVDGIAALQSVELLHYSGYALLHFWGFHFRRTLKISTFCRRFRQDMSDWILFESAGLPDRLAALLLLSNGLTCTDPRDHIYAVRGLAGSSEELNVELSLRVDYKLDIKDVLKNVAIYLLKTRKNLDIFYGVNAKSALQQDLPSWVPTWDGHQHGHLRHYFDNPIRAVTKSVGEPAEYFLSKDNKVLTLKFRPIATVQGIGRPLPATLFNADKKHEFRSNANTLLEEWESLCLSNGPKFGQDDSEQLQRWFSTLFHDENWYENHTFERDCYAVVRGHRGLSEEEKQGLDAHIRLGLGSLAFFSSTGAIPFATDVFYFGLSDGATPEPGDLLCAFKGSSVPYLVRRQLGEERRQYRLIGPCYLYDYMEQTWQLCDGGPPEYKYWIELV
jgi:Heterokaryon incompatibility protein (HET)